MTTAPGQERDHHQHRKGSHIQRGDPEPGREYVSPPDPGGLAERREIILFILGVV